MEMKTALRLYIALTIITVISLAISVIVNNHDLSLLLSSAIGLASSTVTLIVVFTNKSRSHAEN